MIRSGAPVGNSVSYRELATPAELDRVPARSFERPPPMSDGCGWVAHRLIRRSNIHQIDIGVVELGVRKHGGAEQAIRRRRPRPL
jgi:hypothetical protein